MASSSNNKDSPSLRAKIKELYEEKERNKIQLSQFVDENEKIGRKIASNERENDDKRREVERLNSEVNATNRETEQLKAKKEEMVQNINSLQEHDLEIDASLNELQQAYFTSKTPESEAPEPSAAPSSSSSISTEPPQVVKENVNKRRTIDEFIEMITGLDLDSSCCAAQSADNREDEDDLSDDVERSDGGDDPIEISSESEEEDDKKYFMNKVDDQIAIQFIGEEALKLDFSKIVKVSDKALYVCAECPELQPSEIRIIFEHRRAKHRSHPIVIPGTIKQLAHYAASTFKKKIDGKTFKYCCVPGCQEEFDVVGGKARDLLKSHLITEMRKKDALAKGTIMLIYDRYMEIRIEELKKKGSKK